MRMAAIENGRRPIQNGRSPGAKRSNLMVFCIFNTLTSSNWLQIVRVGGGWHKDGRYQKSAPPDPKWPIGRGQKVKFECFLHC